MPLLPTNLMFGPRELHVVRTPAAYRRLVTQAMAKGRAAYPALIWPEPWVYLGVPPIIVNHSRWQVVCACGNYPLYDPAWRLACCLECGAIYEADPPAEWQTIERLLLARPDLATRNWTGEPVPELARENTAHGVAA